MPTEVLLLTEQLLNLKVLYEDAVLGKPIAVIKNISSQIQEIEKKIKADLQN